MRCRVDSNHSKNLSLGFWLHVKMSNPLMQVQSGLDWQMIRGDPRRPEASRFMNCFGG
ncbi:hypothetical protein MESS4_780020 [Mesorhizobium sp. STM 4661]|nr:hypothetical protein MESS4_780020 [Mesorhizobium sp. STM 4661]